MWLPAVLCYEYVQAMRYDDQNTLRIIAEGATFVTVANAAFDPIRRYGRASAEVTLRLLDAMATIAPVICRPEDRLVLERQATLIVRGRSGFSERADRREVQQRYASVSRLLRERFDSVTPSTECRRRKGG